MSPARNPSQVLPGLTEGQSGCLPTARPTQYAAVSLAQLAPSARAVQAIPSGPARREDRRPRDPHRAEEQPGHEVSFSRRRAGARSREGIGTPHVRHGRQRDGDE